MSEQDDYRLRWGHSFFAAFFTTLAFGAVGVTHIAVAGHAPFGIVLFAVATSMFGVGVAASHVWVAVKAWTGSGDRLRQLNKIYDDAVTRYPGQDRRKRT